MSFLALAVGFLSCLGVVLDAFQTIILPRRPAGRFRITRLFFLITWSPWVWVSQRLGSKRLREQMYSIYGPLSLLLLLVVWGFFLVFGFGCLYFALGSPFTDAMLGPGAGSWARFATDLYVSGTTLFTLGLGDVLPHALPARALIIFESGTGLGFVALVIGYVPVLYQAFSRREVSIALLDARAGSPPTATELIRRHGFEGGQEALTALLAEWERWSAEILESHISYPILCYYRSQHDNQSWLSALVAILDTCALLIAIVEGTPARQAQLTFAIARHALIDLGHVFHIEERQRKQGAPAADRLSPEDFRHLCSALGDVKLRLCDDAASGERLHRIRALYEPHAQALADYLRMPLPRWLPEVRSRDQWTTIAQVRSEAEAVLGVTAYISDRATAGHFGNEDQH